MQLPDHKRACSAERALSLFSLARGLHFFRELGIAILLPDGSKSELLPNTSIDPYRLFLEIPA